MPQHPSINVSGENFVLDVRDDPLDLRDRTYEPALIRLKARLDNRASATILNQGPEGACTGFGLATVINLLKREGGASRFRASPRMLYEMAKRHDEWPGEDYSGSSCRGAIRGWHNMGVCEEKAWKYRVGDPDGGLTIERARDAIKNTLGAYYRLRPEITEYHAALNETGAIFASASVHGGWTIPMPKGGGKLPHIALSDDRIGGHAFAIIGYDSEGFILANSWGEGWGAKGFAIWIYEDWVQNIKDGWVFRMALPTPQIFGFEAPSVRASSESEEARRAPIKRARIAGHFVHFDDGSYKEKGDYWSTSEDIRQTAKLIAQLPDASYRHLLIFAHGGLNAPRDSARRISALKEGFKRNGIYPFHIMYDTGVAETLGDVIKNALWSAEERAAGFTDWTDKLIEGAVRKPVTPLWEEMKRDARLPFERKPNGDFGDGMDVIRSFANALANTNKSIHLAGHSTGGVLLGHLLGALDGFGSVQIGSCSLMAPACTIKFFREHYLPRFGKDSTSDAVKLSKLTIYNLNKKLEKDDNVAFAYRKSLLYLVSRALERERKKPILGMQIYSEKLAAKKNLKIIYSDGRSGTVTRSRSHGGFDNDVYTLNHIMKTVLGKPAGKPFKKEELKGY